MAPHPNSLTSLPQLWCHLCHRLHRNSDCRASAYVFLSVTNSLSRDSLFSLPLVARLATTVAVGVKVSFMSSWFLFVLTFCCWVVLLFSCFLYVHGSIVSCVSSIFMHLKCCNYIAWCILITTSTWNLHSHHFKHR